MAELTLTEKFQKLTGIHGLDVEEYISNATDKTKAYNELQWKVAKGAMRNPELLRNASNDSLGVVNSKLYAEVMTELAAACDVAESKADVANIDINSNQSTTDAADKQAQQALSEAYAILDYDAEEDGDGSSSN